MILKLFKYSFLIFLCMVVFTTCKKDEEITKDFFCDVIPDDWECEFVEIEDKFLYMPEYNDTPLYVVRYFYPDSTYTIDGVEYNPELYFNVYPYSKKSLINYLVNTEHPFTPCLPIYYGEKDPFVIVTSSCFINNNKNNERSENLMAPLHKAFKDNVNAFNTSFRTKRVE